ncbi:MAG TPA: glycosyl hydrolase family 28-related protein, partial [Puia sp.]|nr:glycosyl hydrolase family 28-related protein [Puia sp.]
MKRSFFTVLFFALSLATFAQGRDEFNGPYNSWADVKKRFGAHGNGKDDDTKALQNALDGLSNPVTGTNLGAGAYVVVYLPAGTYCISSTLQLKGKIGVTIIGEDPSRTIIKWIAKDSGTMLLCNGSAYFKIGRLTWDNGGVKGMEGIGVHWLTKWNNGTTRSFASLNIELSDMVFTPGFRYGIGGGTVPGPGTGANDSELAIRRCKFQNCTVSGVEILGFNAIDYWIWDCSFIGCNYGIHCTKGTYHAYRCYFSGSTFSDVHNDQGYYVSVRGCYSENSNAFSLDDGSSCNPFKRIFQDNVILKPKFLPVEFYHLGKITLMGNQFSTTVDTTFKISINTKSWCPGIYEVLSLHNSYGYRSPIRIASNPQKLYSFGDTYNPVVRATAAAFLKTMDQTPARVSRKIFEVPAGADAAAIQSLIFQAAALKGQRPIIHFGVGTFYLDRPLLVPPGCDMQLTGDGLIYASVITAKQPASSTASPARPAQASLPALLVVKGPS